MVKGYWLAVMFVAGITVGVMFSRRHADALGDATVPVAPKVPAQLRSADPVEPVTEMRAPAGSRVAREPASGGKTAIEPPRSNAPAQADPVSVGYTGYSEPIDVGPVFREQFAEAQSHGLKSPLLEMHQLLEREVRNDAWAYAAESEIQNSLLADTSVGNFKVDHLECRATSCEVRLSARGKEQSEALARWQQGMRTQPWGNQLEPRASSMIGRDDAADILVILRRPEKNGPEKQKKTS